MYMIELSNGATQGPFKSEEAAYGHIVAWWPGWLIDEGFTIIKLAATNENTP